MIQRINIYIYIMKYEDLILISNPYTVYTKFKKIYPSDSKNQNKHKENQETYDKGPR